ncbi:MAG TPA: PTS fructose transporter subunit IIA [Gammaproteobacteria bacterium]|nr:PTS fructose transporter subunit IIA [Gammaproteobacteria bacterium]
MSNSALLVVTHAPLGNALLQVVAHILGASPEFLKVLDISPTAEQEMVVDEGLLLLEQLDQHEGVVILSDCKGSTPGNIAEQLHSIAFNSSLVYGLNLPMLLRAINYCGQSHQAVANAAVAGARKSIIESEIHHD